MAKKKKSDTNDRKNPAKVSEHTSAEIFWAERLTGCSITTISQRIDWKGISEIIAEISDNQIKRILKKMNQGNRLSAKDNQKLIREVNRINTISTAGRYLIGFEQTIRKLSGMLEGAPDDMDEFAKAKLVYLFLTIFDYYGQFFQDYLIVIGDMPENINMRIIDVNVNIKMYKIGNLKMYNYVHDLIPLFVHN